MARLADRLPENAAGDFFVDTTCIDCDLCRQIAPATFDRDDRHGQSYVARQPADEAGRDRALRALVTCPTASIGTTRKLDSRAAARGFPEPVTADVGFCGYASADSYGAASWLVRRAAGNVLVDSPRFARPLVDALAAAGGVRWMFLSHRDDVADHRAFHERFGCERVLHRDDVSRDTRDIERVLDGPGPWRLADDLLVIAVPGHTRGSCALLHDDILFTGDHLWATDDQTGLEAGREVCWWSWDAQRRSVAKLADYRFAWVLPGHGRRFHAAPEAMHAEVVRLAAAM